MAKKSKDEESPEIAAFSAVYSALKDLDQTKQLRVLRYAAEMLGLNFEGAKKNESSLTANSIDAAKDEQSERVPSLPSTTSNEEVEGINAVALRWIKRSGFEPSKLQNLFSLGIEEIDLVAKSIPGSSKKRKNAKCTSAEEHGCLSGHWGRSGII
jgi:hypothetical protein